MTIPFERLRARRPGAAPTRQSATMSQESAVDERGELHSASGLVCVAEWRGCAWIRRPCDSEGEQREWVPWCKKDDRLERQDKSGDGRWLFGARRCLSAH